MPENSHRQKYNGFSFAFRLTRRTSDHRKETEKDEFSSGNRTSRQEKKRMLRFYWHPRHFARMKKLSSFGVIIKWRKKKIVTWKLISTSQYCKDKEILRTFRPTFTRIGKTWRRIVIFETSSDVISIKHHVGYIPVSYTHLTLPTKRIV